MTTIYLIRHAAAEGNLFHRVQGHYDGVVTDRGYLQIAALRKRFLGMPVDAVYASDLFRAQTTALAIALPRGLEIISDRELREINFGVWENVPRAAIRHDTPELLALFNAYDPSWHVPGSESIADALLRIENALRRIVEKHPAQTVMVVSHGHILQLLFGALEGMSPERAAIESLIGKNTSVTKLEADANGIRIACRDDASHLLGLPKGQAFAKGGKPEIYFAARSRECVTVMHGDRAEGEICVRAADGERANIERLELDRRLRGRGIGVQLIGQAVTMARAQGRDTLFAEIPNHAETVRRRAAAYGFAAVEETETGTLWEKYYGYSEQYRLSKVDEAIRMLQGTDIGRDKK